MRLLAQGFRGRESCLLPLSDRAAVGLAVGLLARDSCALEAFRATLVDDAPLALWAVVGSHERCGLAPRTTTELARFLVNHVLAELHGAKEGPESSVDLAEHAAELAGRAAGIAQLAAEVARRVKSVDADETYFLGLLHVAREWIAIANAQSTDASLPPWLHLELKRLDELAADEVPSATSPVGCVAATIAIVAGRSHPAARPDLDQPAFVDRVARAREDWLAQRSFGVNELLALVDRLARLQALEHHFDRKLETEKLESLKELAYGAGHEINNPLANISARAQTLLADESDPERRRKLAAINAQAFRAHEMIADMMLFARPPKLSPERFDVAELSRTVIFELSAAALGQDTELVVRAAEPAEIVADRVQLAVALRALCVNSLEALGHGGRVEVLVRRVTGLPESADGRSGAAAVEIAVADDGPGISEEVRRHLFDPFYSGREAGRGLGFGLSKCWRIVREHGGTIDVTSSPGLGATLTITLPEGKAESGKRKAESGAHV